MSQKNKPLTIRQLITYLEGLTRAFPEDTLTNVKGYSVDQTLDPTIVTMKLARIKRKPCPSYKTTE